MSPNDWNNDSDGTRSPRGSEASQPTGADGWVAPDARPTDYADPAERRGPEIDLSQPHHYPLQRVEPEPEADPEQQAVQDGKAMAILAHLSILFGVPVFLIPLLQRNNAFALHHGKAAGVIYLLFLLTGVASFITCGLAVPLVLLLYVPAIIGIVKAAEGEEAGPWGLGDFGERVFSGVELKDESD